MIETQDVAPNKDTRIAFVGDFAFPFSASVLANVDSVSEITGADTVVGNLESSMISHDKRHKLINLYSTASLRAFMAQQGISIVSLANNHVMDYGKEGLQQLLNLLHEAGVHHCGAGMDLSEATTPVEVRIGGKNGHLSPMHGP